MTEPLFEITKAASFDAAHHMTHPSTDARYRRMHGHSFQVEASLRGPAGAETGWVEDFGALDAALRAVAEELDHGLLNEHEGLETTTLEHLCLHFARRRRKNRSVPEYPKTIPMTEEMRTIEP